MEKINEEILQKYATLKRKLKELQEQENGLREQLLKELDLIGKEEYETDYIKIIKRIQKRISYPKADVEKEVPEEILAKIRKEKEIIYLMSTLKDISNTG